MGAQIRFWKDPYKNAEKSREAGIPVFDTVDWYEVRVLGEPDNTVGPWHRAPPEIVKQWSDSYRQWQKDNATEGIIGTPLSEVAWLERGMVETLKYLGIRTLENLANVADSSIGKIPGGLALRQKSRDTLAAAKESAPLQRMSEELAKRDEQIASLEARINDLIESKRKKAKEAT